MSDGKYSWPTGNARGVLGSTEPRLDLRSPEGRRRPRLRGVAVPAALVGASVLLVLLVVAVSALMGSGSGRIPLGASATVQGRVLDKQTHLGQGGQVPPGSSTSGFQPVSMEAETAALGGSAVSAACDGCSGGSMVRFVGGAGAGTGTVTFRGLNVPATGTYHLTVGCLLDDDSHGPFVVSVNGAVAASVTCPVVSWSSPSPTTVAITLQGGTSNTVALGNPTTPAPDLDGITLSQ